ncbi:hypothetical protein [Pseudomonas sp. LD120]|uniref:hypothetical protein n=1 Tax=Pseudomonas sp. LD120 TaxID=485751 RepID=UPI001358249F|nr:hypothetical protein [Pseudomonas sp. LD120]KAF0865880.1 hypothetical protein PLD_11590 [Pseudomonas sp. LD120]
MPTETQHLEQRVAALQSDLNRKDEQIDALTFSDNDRELSRRDWFEAAQAAEKRVEELGGLLRRVASLGVQRPEHDSPAEVETLEAEIDAALSASAEPSAPIAKQELQLEDPERQRLIAWGRNCGLEEASKVCQRMAHEAYYPPGTRFKHFTPKAQMRLGDILIKAANAIGGLPDGPYERFHARQGNKTR